MSGLLCFFSFLGVLELLHFFATVTEEPIPNNYLQGNYYLRGVVVFYGGEKYKGEGAILWKGPTKKPEIAYKLISRGYNLRKHHNAAIAIFSLFKLNFY